MVQILTPINKSKMTVGEKRFINLLQTHLDDEYICWFDLPINNRHLRFPDILLLHKNLGLLCLEVKDWKKSNFMGINAKYIQMLFNGNVVSHILPHLQARDCLFPVINKLQNDPLLIQKSGNYQGHLKCPWGFGGVMTYWKKSSLTRELENIINTEYYFFEEDLSSDLSRETFIKKLTSMMPYQFNENLTQQDIDRIRAHLFPEIKIEQRELFHNEEDIIKVMDYIQEKEARSIGDGHRVIHGVAGSGKTVLLKHRAKVLSNLYPNKKILVICYNKSLAKSLKQYFSESNIEVYHFHGWCEKIKYTAPIVKNFLDLKKKEDNTQYINFLSRAICRAIEKGLIIQGQYAAVLIDEGHDFSPEWLKALAKMPDPAHNQLLLLYDDAQSIYKNNRGLKFSLSSVGINARGRTKILHKNYRNSQEISLFADAFLHRFIPINETVDIDDIPLCSSIASGKKTGSIPKFKVFNSLADEINAVIKQIKIWQSQKISCRDIAVLFPPSQSELKIVNKIRNALQNSNIAYSFIKEDFFTKDKDRDCIALSTIHSSKGLEFPCVILFGIGSIDLNNNTHDYPRLLYVGITRAKEKLWISATGHNLYVSTLQNITQHDNKLS